MLCRSCLLEKTADGFYASNRTRCKECIKASVRQNRLENIEHYREFDRKRAMRPDRVAAREAYQNTPEGKMAMARSRRKYAVIHAIRRKAHIAVGNAVRDGKLKPQPCFICGGKAEAHHPDYSRPLSVMWLCRQHHKDAHRLTMEILHEASERETMHF